MIYDKCQDLVFLSFCSDFNLEATVLKQTKLPA